MKKVFNDPKSFVISGNEDNLQIDESAKKTIDKILEHKEAVRKSLLFLTKELERRADIHDNSKLKEPEIGWLIAMDKEPYCQYGTSEYFEKMKRWEKFFKHHYENNSHHPDHYSQGVYEMDILDIVEFCTDIISYCKNLRVSQAIKLIDEQSERFNIEGELKAVITNTLLRYFSDVGDFPSPKKEAEMISDWKNFLEKEIEKKVNSKKISIEI